MIEEEIGELGDQLREYKKQLDALREDLKIVVQYSTTLRNSIIGVANQAGSSSFDPEEVQRCQEFRDKYQIGTG